MGDYYPFYFGIDLLVSVVLRIHSRAIAGSRRVLPSFLLLFCCFALA